MSIWKQTFTLEGLNGLSKGNLGEHLGIHFFAYGPECIWASMPVNDHNKQPMGLLHGGASVALAETMGSVASTLCIEDMSTHSVVGTEINASHLRSVRKGKVIAYVSPIRIGRRIHVWNITITDQRQRKVCVTRLSTMIVSRK